MSAPSKVRSQSRDAWRRALDCDRLAGMMQVADASIRIRRKDVESAVHRDLDDERKHAF